jgi:hypothetical protein
MGPVGKILQVRSHIKKKICEKQGRSEYDISNSDPNNRNMNTAGLLEDSKDHCHTWQHQNDYFVLWAFFGQCCMSSKFRLLNNQYEPARVPSKYSVLWPFGVFVDTLGHGHLVIFSSSLSQKDRTLLFYSLTV